MDVITGPELATDNSAGLDGASDMAHGALSESRLSAMSESEQNFDSPLSKLAARKADIGQSRVSLRRGSLIGLAIAVYLLYLFIRGVIGEWRMQRLRLAGTIESSSASWV